MAANGLRLRLLEPSVGVVAGGSTLLVHGRGFRPPPHSLLVRFRLLDAVDGGAAAVRVDVSGKFLLESQLEVIVPSLEHEAKQIVAARTNLSMSSASVSSAPQVVRVAVEVILDSMQTSNALEYCVHQALSVRKISPQHVLMAPPTAVTLMLNILKLPSRLAGSSATQEQPLAEITALPVFVRVKHRAERTGILSEQTRPGRWKVSSQGVFEVEFDAVMLGYGVASVEVSLNRVHFFRGGDKVPESLGYKVHRDALLESMEPCTINVTSGRATDVRIFGTGFVDTGDLVVALAQPELPLSEAAVAATATAQPVVTVAQLNATFVSQKEIHCSVQANMPFGLTTFRVSPNGGKQFGNTSVVALLYRHRPLESITPASGSLSGNTTVHLHHSSLLLEGVDAMSQIQHLVPPRRVRVRFQALNEDGSPIDGLCKVVNAEDFIGPGGREHSEPGRAAVVCRTPSFFDELKTLHSEGRKVRFDYDGDVPLRVKHFAVSIALGSDAFADALDFAYYFPPTIRSVTRHHGPATGGTSILIRVKYKVPRRLSLLVRFLSLRTNKFQVVPGKRFGEQTKGVDPSDAQRFDDAASSFHTFNGNDDPDCLIYCETPAWTVTEELPHLTKIQVSYDGGAEFFPLDTPEPPFGTPRTSRTTGSQPLTHAIVRDWSYLYFLFYKTPSFNAVLPMSADIQGGSSIRIMGEHIVDHGAQVMVVFHSPLMSRKVLGFVEKGEVRCCAPPFNVGTVDVYVSFNSEQYTKCSFKDPETSREIDFVFYSSPSIRSISPLCASVSKTSVIHISGANLIETGRIKVRFGFTTSHGKFVHKDVPGKARDGVITASSPTFSSEFANTSASVDVALNGNDFTGTTVPLYYFSSFQIQRVEPRIGAAEIPIPVSLQISPSIVTDRVVVCLRFKLRNTAKESAFGPIEVNKWTSDRVAFTLPAIVSYAETVDALTNVFVDVSFDGSGFHTIGDLLSHYKVYNMPHLTSMSPLYGLFDRETEVTARGACMQLGDTVKISLFLQNSLSEFPNAHTTGRTQVPVAVIVAEVNVKRQVLAWKCPRLAHVCSASWPGIQPTDRMILDEFLTMQVSVVDGQAMTLPFKFRYYRTPTLVAMDPCIGYTCSGSVISFEFREPIETPMVDFRFGTSEPSGGRLRDGRFVECFSPEIEKGVHEISVSFNEQQFEALRLVVDEEASDESDDGASSAGEEEDAGSDAQSSVTAIALPKPVTFEAFPLPVFMVPRNADRVCGFGPIGGGTVVLIKGLGFVPGTRIYVRFCSPYRDGLGEGTSDVVVKAGIVDTQTIQCTAPPSLRTGRVGLHVSYNLQQFIDSTCYFEYHRATTFEGKGTLCGPVSGKTPVTMVVQSGDGLPVNQALVECSVRFASSDHSHVVDVAATFDPETLAIACVAPAWPANELVRLWVTLARGPFEEFVDSRVQFLFYDPPEGVIQIEPCAGPITGGTNVLAWCGKLVDTGEITVCITLYDHANPTSQEEASVLCNDSTDSNSESGKTSILVKGTIIGDAVSFVTPPVDAACVALLNISLNGINYTAIQQNQNLRYNYYVAPVVRRVFPGWCSTELPCDIRVSGDNIVDYGCKVLVRFVRQQAASDPLDNSTGSAVVEGRLVSDPSGASSPLQVETSFPPVSAGFYEVEITLNGQQFSNSHYMSASFGNFSGAVCTSLLPFRVFAASFFLATSTGPAAGGSTVVLFLTKKLLKLLAKETRCAVQFTPLRPSGETPLPLGLSANSKNVSSVVLDPVTVQAEIDQLNGKVTCRAPLLRVACVAAVDILLPASSDSKTSASQMFNSKERERYYSYESPAITEIYPSCGPLSGNTWLVIEATNIIDTGQIFVRFRSTTNERECAIIPGTYSRRFPDGSLSSSPLIVCRTPEVEFVDKIISDPVATNGTANATTPAPPNAPSGGAGSATRRAKELAVGKARAQIFQVMAEQSMNARSMSFKGGSAKLKSVNTLRLTRAQSKSAATGPSTVPNAIDLVLGTTVLVDFTLNAGEQFIAHSVKFHYHGELDTNEIKWSPRHFPTKSLSRASAQARMLTVQLPRGFRLNDLSDRICFRFDGDPQPILAKRRGSSIVLHETSATRELLSLDAPKLRSQATGRRRSTIMRNTSMSASSTSLLSMSSPPNALLSAPTPPSRPRSKQAEAPSSTGTRPTTTNSPAPFIAGKAASVSEITCPVPDFSTDGPVKVSISLNAQQFVYLGELHFHSPIAIAEDEQFRFCSSVGGARFTLHSSVSSILKFVSPVDVTNEADQSKGEFDNVLMKPSKALQCLQPETLLDVGPDKSPEPCGDTSVVADSTGVRWQKRVFCAFYVVLVPPNPTLLSKVTVKASRPGSLSEVGSQTPDSNGCCVFEVTDWVGDMALRAELAPVEAYLPYSCIARRNYEARSEWSTSLTRMPLILIQRPPADRIGVVLFNSTGLQSCELQFQTSDGANSCLKSELKGLNLPVMPEGALQHIELDRETMAKAGVSECFLCAGCVATNSLPVEADGRQSTKGDLLQILVGDSEGVKVALLGETVSTCTWAVARVLADSGTPNSFAVLPVDCLLSSRGDILAISPSDASENATSPRQMSVQTVENIVCVPVQIQFSPADSSISLSASTPGKVILSGDSNVVEFFRSPPGSTQVKMECSMPPLPFSGPTNVMVSFGGVMFSNFVCIHCYDPRTWNILAIEPPCGLVRKPVAIRIQGENFVETNKISVRFAAARRYFTVRGALSRSHLLIVRIAAIKNVRAMLASLGNAGSSSSTDFQRREDDKVNGGGSGAGGAGIYLPPSFTLTVRIECGDQKVFASCRESSVVAALSQSSSLSWEEQFEIQVASKLTSLLVVVVEIADTSLPKPVELARGVLQLNSLQEGVQRRKSVRLERHFHRGVLLPYDPSATSSSPESEVDLALHLSPLMLQPNYIVCSVDGFSQSETITVQVSPGGNMFSSLPVLTPRNSFQVYELPVVTNTTPRVLPRSAGGEILISGSNFIDADGSGRVCIRLFCCFRSHFGSADTERQVLQEINRVDRLQQADSGDFFVRDIEGTVKTSSSISCAIPPSLASYSIFYRLSFDGREFTEASARSHLLLFSVHSIDPKGGPVSGNTYAALHGVNIHACLSPKSSTLPLNPVVRLSWMRGTRELESVVVPGEFYAPDDTIYFYTPQSRFGLQNIAVTVELALASSDATAEESGASPSPPAPPRFSRDEVSFIMYKVPVIRGVAPAASLIPGLSSLELAIQGFDEKSTRGMKQAFKVRFKQRGQMQVADISVTSEARFDCLVPRFNINHAVATEISAPALPPPAVKVPQPSPRSKAATGTASLTGNLRQLKGPSKIWTRATGVFVIVLGARGLHVSKKHTCNPFVVLTCGKSQLKSTRKDATFSPVWNEVFDFEWPNPELPTIVRIVLENQLTLDQSEFLGQVEFALGDRKLQAPFGLRAWLPLRRLRGKNADNRSNDTSMLQSLQSDSRRRGGDGAPGLGEIEIALAFIPPSTAAKLPRDIGKRSSAAALRSSILSVLSSRIASKNQGTMLEARTATSVSTPSRKERLLRAFKHKGPPMSLVPTELQIELALNGQDFWSVAPTRCYTLPPPMVLSVEPSFISVAGGTLTYIAGLNFVNSGTVRVAFVMDGGPQRGLKDEDSFRLHADRAIAVDAKYRSSTSLVCMSPSLKLLDGADAASVRIYVCLNGMDFDSVALPREVVKSVTIGDIERSESPRNESISKDNSIKQAPPLNQTKPCSVFVALENDQYVVNCGEGVNGSVQPLDYHIRVYQVPKIVCVRPTDGTYTSHLTFDGSSFTNTGIAVARFTSISDEKDVRVSKLEVLSSTQMGCSVPDFPRGSVVRIDVSMNGVEFIPHAQELRLFQLPRLTDIAPTWISASSSLPLLLRGINLMAAAATSSPNGVPTIHVSMVRGQATKAVTALCVDGEAHCSIPRELLSSALESDRRDPVATPRKPGWSAQELEIGPPIIVDIRLGGARKELTGKPLLLRIYREIPTVTSVSPMDGPIYGGFSIVVEGKGFVNTESIVVRFQYFPLQCDDAEGPTIGDTKAAGANNTPRSTKGDSVEVKRAAGTTGSAAPSDENPHDVAAFVDSPAKFISTERILCPAPVFPQEGVYVVLVALNGVEFTTVNEATWFLAWQNWQKRKQLLMHDLFAAPRLAREVAVSVASPRGLDASMSTTIVGTLDESEIERLRRKTTFMLPQIKGANRPPRPEPGSLASPRAFNPLQEDELEEHLAELVNPKLLHWHPASAADEKGQPLLALLDSLCNSRESQKIICRRLRIVFRMKGEPCANDCAEERGENGHDELDGDGRSKMPVSLFEIAYPGFVQGMRLIFPHALERDLESLWSACEGTASGRLTFDSLMAKVMRPLPDRRCGSPEPGPTHYNPQFDVVSPRAPAAVVLPQVPEPEATAGLPSELFINYDTAYKSVKPATPGVVFRKRKFNTSWCNPVSQEEASIGRGGGKSPEAAAAVVGSASSASLAKKTPHPPLPPPDINPPVPPLAADISGTAISAPVAVPSKENAPRSPEQIATVHGVQTGSKLGTGVAIGGTGLRTDSSTAAALQSGTNLFYNDISPMYLKFLRSKEIQRLMKLAEEDSESDNRPSTRSGPANRERR